MKKTPSSKPKVYEKEKYGHSFASRYWFKFVMIQTNSCMHCMVTNFLMWLFYDGIMADLFLDCTRYGIGRELIINAIKFICVSITTNNLIFHIMFTST